MKNKDTISAIIGGTFFAIPYLGLSIPILPSLAIGTGAFIAGKLVLSKEEINQIEDESIILKRTLDNARNQNNHVIKMTSLIEDDNIVTNLKEITNNVEKIINTIENNPTKIKNINNFFDYYLPVTIKIVDRYDEIENQNLSSKESKKFKESTNKMVIEINEAFKNILNNLYQSDMIDTDAEMKVFKSILKSDGFDNSDIEIKEKEDENE